MTCTPLLLLGRVSADEAVGLGVFVLLAAVLAGLFWGLRGAGGVRARSQRVINALLAGDAVDVDAVLASLAPAERALAAALIARALAESVRGDVLDDAHDLEPEDGDAPDDDEDGLGPGPLATLALALGRRAVAEAQVHDVTTRSEAALALALLGEVETASDLVTELAPRPDLDAAALHRLGRAALGVGADETAERLLARALEAAPGDLDVIAARAEALLALDRADEAVPLLEAALRPMRRRMEALEWGAEALQGHWERLASLHDVAVRRSSSAEKAIDLHVATGALDAHAGVNYRLMGHSLLVDSDRAPRRVIVPDQTSLRAAADAALARAKDDPAGLEDLGLWHLREDEPELAERAFRRAIEADPRAWPAFVGLGAALDARRRSLRRWLADSATPPSIPDLPRLVDDWTALTADEQRLVALSIAPVAAAVPTLVAGGGRLHIVALDARCTDLPTFAEGRGAQVEHDDDGRTHDAIDGMALGLVVAAKVETFYEHHDGGWTVAHELGHALLELLSDELHADVEALFARAEEAEYLSTDYGQRNVHEFFATGYERFAWRQAFPGAPRDEIHAADVTLGLDAFFRDLAAAIASMPPVAGAPDA